MNILDKLNLHFKIPTAVILYFNSIEQSFIDRIEIARSFKDVEEISKDVWEYAKENKKDEELVQNPHGDDHSWFAGYMEIDNTPVVSLSVLVEHGGKGSIEGATISRKIFQFVLENDIVQ